MKPNTIQKREMNGLLHQILRLRDGAFCLRCGETNQELLQMSHIYPKGTHGRMEFNPDNVKLLCHMCHVWWHANPKDAKIWLATKLSKDRLERLKRDSTVYLVEIYPKARIEDLKRLLAVLKAKQPR